MYNISNKMAVCVDVAEENCNIATVHIEVQPMVQANNDFVSSEQVP